MGIEFSIATASALRDIVTSFLKTRVKNQKAKGRRQALSLVPELINMLKTKGKPRIYL